MRRQRELRIFSGWFGNRPLPATRTLTDHGGENRPIAGELLRFFRRRVAVGGVRHGIIDAPNLGTRVVDQLFDSALVLDGVQNFPAADSASEIADHLHMAANFSEKRMIERVRIRRPSNGITVLRIARNRRDRSLYLPSLFVVDVSDAFGGGETNTQTDRHADDGIGGEHARPGAGAQPGGLRRYLPECNATRPRTGRGQPSERRWPAAPPIRPRSRIFRRTRHRRHEYAVPLRRSLRLQTPPCPAGRGDN